MSRHIADVENPGAMYARMQETVQGLEDSLKAIKEELKGYVTLILRPLWL
jgi:hypothetical protein